MGARGSRRTTWPKRSRTGWTSTRMSPSVPGDPATWPAGFVRTVADREAMLVLASIPGLTARRLEGLASGRGIAGGGVAVISGGARGIDAAAHEGALGVGGPTVAVLGCGIDVVYPMRNRRLLERVAAAGAVVSEYPPGVPAQPFRFPA